jgi:predicted nucleic acid-binding protein
VALLLDTGALIAFERGDRRVAALLEATRRRRHRIITSSGCVAQAWRGEARQARLSRLLAGTAEVPLDPSRSRRVGEVCATTGLADVVDAHLALLAHDSDAVVTSDLEDFAVLLRAARCSARTVKC